MNPQAENRFTVTQELFMEGMLRVSRDSYGKYAAKAMMVFAGIWLALLAFTLVFKGNLANVFFCLFVIVLLGLWLCVWTPRSTAKKAWKKLVSQHGEHPLRITRFYEDHLEISGDCTDKTVSYADIKEIQQSKHLLILMCYDKVGIMASLDGFTRGDLHTVHALIGGDKIRT